MQVVQSIFLNGELLNASNIEAVAVVVLMHNRMVNPAGIADCEESHSYREENAARGHFFGLE